MTTHSSAPLPVPDSSGALKAAGLAMLRASVGDPDAEFRPGQWEAIEDLVLRRNRLLVVERTGWGKSLVYFVATRLLRERGGGPTVIISPLQALMHNQVDAAARLGVRAEYIDSTNKDNWPVIEAHVLAGRVDALIITPERLANTDFQQRVLSKLYQRLGLLVVDEAHCISDWGHDFRTDYRRITNFIQRLPPNIPVLGTTATANDRVIEDVRAQFGNMDVQRGPLMRESLALQTIRLGDQSSRLAWLSTYLPELPGTGIVYVLTKRDAELVSGYLQAEGINALPYYSDVEHEDFEDRHAYRAHLEEALSGNNVKALVSTSALGMGYDKPDLGFVVHFQAPGSVIAYYQQVGRAGRSIDHAYGVMLTGNEDGEIHAFFRRAAFPDEGDVANILNALDEADGLSVPELEKVVNLRRGDIDKALVYMATDTPAPVFKDGSKWRRAPVAWSMDREKIEWLTRQREDEWATMERYAEHDGCLMIFLAQELNDDCDACGRCASCTMEGLLSVDIPHEAVLRAARFARQAEMVIKLPVRVPRGAMPQTGLSGNIPHELRAEEGRVLSQWNDAGWGAIAAQDKAAGHFRDALVEAVAEMIVERWEPDPSPQWVTCIPSLNHPELVPDFARRLADRLGLPLIAAVEKIRDTEPQKRQENTFHRCQNLDGSFQVTGGVIGEPVLLVDDMKDSGWTFSIATALLRQSGCGAVFPVAICNTSASG